MRNGFLKKKNNHKAWYNLGTVSFNLGNYKKAEEAFNKSLEIEPKYSESLSNLGSLFCNQNKYIEAIPHFKNALAYATDDIKDNIKAKLADCYLMSENYKDAQPLISELYESDEEMALMLEGKMVRKIIPGKITSGISTFIDRIKFWK